MSQLSSQAKKSALTNVSKHQLSDSNLLIKHRFLSLLQKWSKKKITAQNAYLFVPLTVFA